MKIWVIGRSYPLPINNMQGSFELEQAKMLAKHGNDVSFIACVFHPYKKVKKWGYMNWNEDDICIYTNSQVYTIERMKLHLHHYKSHVWKKLLKRVEEQSGLPDVIHVHYPSNITVSDVILEYQKRGVRIVCTEHWSQVLRKVIDKYEMKQLTAYVEKADSFFCVGTPLRKSVLDLTNTDRDIIIIPNVVSDAFRPRSDKYSRFTFVAVGGLFPHKQFNKIVDAFAKIQLLYDDIDLVIIGSGPDERKLKSLIHNYGLENKVRLTGKLSHNNTAEIVGKCSTLICYSKYETFGVPIIEGWSCGIPVIASTAAAVTEEWDIKTGIQVSPDNSEELVFAMKAVRDNIDTYENNYIRNYALSRYSEQVVYDRLMKFYSRERNR